MISVLYLLPDRKEVHSHTEDIPIQGDTVWMNGNEYAVETVCYRVGFTTERINGKDYHSGPTTIVIQLQKPQVTGVKWE